MDKTRSAASAIAGPFLMVVGCLAAAGAGVAATRTLDAGAAAVGATVDLAAKAPLSGGSR